jgi:hypothetical protein
MPIAPFRSPTADTPSAPAPSVDDNSSNDNSDGAAGGGVTPDPRVGEGNLGGITTLPPKPKVEGEHQEITNEDYKKSVPMNGD